MIKTIKNLFKKRIVLDDDNQFELDIDNQFELDGTVYTPFSGVYTKSKSSFIKWCNNSESFDEFDNIEPAEKFYQTFVSINKTKYDTYQVITVERQIVPEVKKVLSVVARLEMTVQDLEFDIESLKQSNSDGFYNSRIESLKNTINNLNAVIEYYKINELSIYNDSNFDKVVNYEKW